MKRMVRHRGLLVRGDNGSPARNARLLSVIGLACFIFGTITACVVFAEVQIMHSYYYVGNTPVYFTGYPYGTYQVATGLCLAKLAGWTADNPVCAFFNYDQLLLVAVAAAFVGFVVWRYYRS